MGEKRLINLLPKESPPAKHRQKSILEGGAIMKNVIISSDGDRMVYSVPDIVADNLAEYCIAFCDKWLRTSPQAKKYRIKDCLCYNEGDFIEYLNTYIFPKEQSVFIENLGPMGIDESQIPESYQNCPSFNF